MPKARFGKSASDRKNGARSRNAANKHARDQWLRENRGASGQGRQTHQFPEYSCGGKGNSSRPFKMIGGKRTQTYTTNR